MKPNFALTLSSEGLRLLHRAPSGWLLVGDVAFDSADMAGEVASLREMAARLDPEPMRAKLVIPNDQIKFLTVASTAKTEAEAEDDAAHALRGATPYALSELAFDWAMDDGQLFIAAVARETLDEAFATEYKFNPVSFVALPELNSFAGEPFFGVARSARAFLPKTDSVTRDLQPIHVIGRADIPEPEIELIEVETEAEAEPVTERPAPPEAAPDAVTAAPEAPVLDASEEPKAAAPIAFSSVRANAQSSVANPAPDPSNYKDSVVQLSPEMRAQAQERPARKGNLTLSAPSGDKAAPTIPPAPAAAASEPPAPALTQSERQRMTVFGQRGTEGPAKAARGKPRHLGLVLGGLLVIFLVLVAIWAAFLGDDEVADLLGAPEEIQIASTPANEATAEEMAEARDVEAAGDPVESETSETQSVTPALLPDTPRLLSVEEATRQYLATGIWQIAPDQPLVPDASGNADVYLASIDPTVRSVDALALPEMGEHPDVPPAQRVNPAAAGTSYDLDDRGLVKSTPQGALTPDGILVFAGRPAVVPPRTPTRFEVTPNLAETSRLSGIRPKARPDNLQEKTERDQLGGRTRTELASLRPRIRPETEKQQQELDQTPTAQAVALSLKPRLRPDSLSKVVATARSQPQAQPKVATTNPVIPSSASVARQATVKNALDLRNVSLIGVYGKPSDRRALVRLSNGRYQKVQVGDRIDGGKVAAIGETELRYIKNGRDVVLKMPRG